MPPITTVPPFSTSTSVLTCLVLIATPPAVAAPGASLLTSSVMEMLPSGVICGFTLSARLALRNETAVAPEEVADWYGISVPCSISASTWSAVSTRGLEMILPLPSASSAEISTLRIRDSEALNSTKENCPAWKVLRPAAGVAADRPAARILQVAEAHAEVLAEAVVRFDDARLDHHLTNGDVDLGEQAAHFFQAAGRVLHEQRVGARVDHGAAALGEDALGRVGEQLLHVGRLLVAHLERFGARLLEVIDLLRRLERQLLARRQLVARRDPDHVSAAAAVEAARLQDDLERLVPRHVLQAQGNVSRHRVAGDDVEVGEVGDHIEHRPHLDVLEVERELLAGVATALPLARRIRHHRLYLHHELGVALVGVVLPLPLRLDHHAHVLALLERADRVDRRAEIDHVEAPAQVVGQRGLEKLDDDVLALLADVDAGAGVGEIDHHAALAGAAAAEVDVADSVLGLGLAFGEMRDLSAGRGLHDRRLGKADQQRAALEARLMRHGAAQVQHQPGAVAALHHVHAAQLALADVLAGAAERVDGIR